MTCLGFEVTAPFSSVRGGVGFHPQPNFEDLSWAETSSVDPFSFRPLSSLNTSVIWDKAGLAGTKLSRHLYGTKKKKKIQSVGRRAILFIFLKRACSPKPSDVICSRGQLERLQPGVARGAFLFGSSEVLEAICMALSMAVLSGQTVLPT